MIGLNNKKSLTFKALLWSHVSGQLSKYLYTRLKNRVLCKSLNFLYCNTPETAKKQNFRHNTSRQGVWSFVI